MAFSDEHGNSRRLRKSRALDNFVIEEKSLPILHERKKKNEKRKVIHKRFCDFYICFFPCLVKYLMTYSVISFRNITVFSRKKYRFEWEQGIKIHGVIRLEKKRVNRVDQRGIDFQRASSSQDGKRGCSNKRR